MTKLFLFDIEGTTTDINFVHQVLFPYSKKHLRSFITLNSGDPRVTAALKGVSKTVLEETEKTLTFEGAIDQLERWIAEDRKHGSLKEIQGLIWDKGYSENHFRGHVYPDVKPAFERIKNNDGTIGIYSSGSVHAQKLIFGFSEAGDLTPYISYYFDTKIGHKRESKSYEQIAQLTKTSPEEIHFFSDIVEELEAASAVGFGISHVVRDQTKPSRHPMIKDFSGI